MSGISGEVSSVRLSPQALISWVYEPLILYLGRFYYGKEVEHLMIGAPIVLRDSKNTKFLLENIDYFENMIKKLLEKIGINDSIIFRVGAKLRATICTKAKQVYNWGFIVNELLDGHKHTEAVRL